MRVFLFIASFLLFLLGWRELAVDLTGFIGWFLTVLGGMSFIGGFCHRVRFDIGMGGSESGDSSWSDSAGDGGGD